MTSVRFFVVSLCAAVAVSALGLVCGAPTVSAASKPADRGAELFRTHGCAHCHGENGVGGGRGPDLQLVRKRLSGTAIAQQIHDGGKGMPAYGDQLTDPEVDDLVAFLKARRPFIVVPKPLPTPAPIPPDPS